MFLYLSSNRFSRFYLLLPDASNERQRGTLKMAWRKKERANTKVEYLSGFISFCLFVCLFIYLLVEYHFEEVGF